MNASPFVIDLPSPDATQRFGARMAETLGPGDCLLLEGGLGAGKTALARAIISALLPEPEDIPSPTFTLVQTYETPHFEIWHCDLYRLSGPEELIELGLDAAFNQAVTLIEWPDRLGKDTPEAAQHLSLTPSGEHSRQLTIRGDTRWAQLAQHGVAQ